MHQLGTQNENLRAAGRGLFEETMINKITDHETERCNNAIRNLRTLAKNAKKTKIVEAVQISELLIIGVDHFRKYCHVNGAGGNPSDTYTVFKHDDNTFRLYIGYAEALPNLRSLLSAGEIRSNADEYRQVEILFADIVEYLADKTGRMVTHAKK